MKTKRQDTVATILHQAEALILRLVLLLAIGDPALVNCQRWRRAERLDVEPKRE
jgi:hypothetical protein